MLPPRGRGLQLCAWSDAFRFQDRHHIEFCAGMCLVHEMHSNTSGNDGKNGGENDATADGCGVGVDKETVVLSWGLNDREPRMSTLPAKALRTPLEAIQEHHNKPKR